MAKITLYLNKSIEENAGLYYEKAKRIKKKIEGAKKAVESSIRKLEVIEKEKTEQRAKPKIIREKKWYEKFRWFISSEGFLVIGGRDATTNEIIIKKHTDANDIIFHTDMAGSPFFVVKVTDKKPTKKTLDEVADATVSFSRAWRLGMQNSPVFHVEPEQVSKKAKAGEYLTKGAFMIYGKTNYIENKVNLAVGITDDGAIMAAPVSAVKANCKKYVEIKQGREKTSKIAKYIQKRIGGELDEIIRALPSGGCEIKS